MNQRCAAVLRNRPQFNYRHDFIGGPHSAESDKIVTGICKAYDRDMQSRTRKDTLQVGIYLPHLFATSGNPYPVNPPFYVIPHGYDMDITTSGICFSKCHSHVISMSYLFFKKDIFGYTWYILN